MNQPIFMTRAGQTYYYQTNAHGDVVSLTNESGTVVNTYTYDPWGKVLSSTEGVPNPYRYAGYRYDEATGLYYLQARYYSPTFGAFIAKDTCPGERRNPQSMRPYLYCNNNPVNQIDPTGESFAIIAVGVAFTPEAVIAIAVVSLVAAYLSAPENQAFLAENIGHIKDVIKGLLNQADTHIGKCSSEPPDIDPQKGWKKEIKAMLDRAERLTKKYLRVKTRVQTLKKINAIRSKIPE